MRARAAAAEIVQHRAARGSRTHKDPAHLSARGHSSSVAISEAIWCRALSPLLGSLGSILLAIGAAWVMLPNSPVVAVLPAGDEVNRAHLLALICEAGDMCSARSTDRRSRLVPSRLRALARAQRVPPCWLSEPSKHARHSRRRFARLLRQLGHAIHRRRKAHQSDRGLSAFLGAIPGLPGESLVTTLDQIYQRAFYLSEVRAPVPVIGSRHCSLHKHQDIEQFVGSWPLGLCSPLPDSHWSPSPVLSWSVCWAPSRATGRFSGAPVASQYWASDLSHFSNRSTSSW